MTTKQFKLPLEVRKYKAEAQAKWRANKKQKTNETKEMQKAIE